MFRSHRRRVCGPGALPGPGEPLDLFEFWIALAERGHRDETDNHCQQASLHTIVSFSLNYGFGGRLDCYCRGTAMSATEARCSLPSSPGASLIFVERLPPPTMM